MPTNRRRVSRGRRSVLRTSVEEKFWRGEAVDYEALSIEEKLSWLLLESHVDRLLVREGLYLQALHLDVKERVRLVRGLPDARDYGTFTLPG